MHGGGCSWHPPLLCDPLPRAGCCLRRFPWGRQMGDDNPPRFLLPTGNRTGPTTSLPIANTKSRGYMLLVLFKTVEDLKQDAFAYVMDLNPYFKEGSSDLRSKMRHRITGPEAEERWKRYRVLTGLDPNGEQEARTPRRFSGVCARRRRFRPHRTAFVIVPIQSRGPLSVF